MLIRDERLLLTTKYIKIIFNFNQFSSNRFSSFYSLVFEPFSSNYDDSISDKYPAWIS